MSESGNYGIGHNWKKQRKKVWIFLTSNMTIVASMDFTSSISWRGLGLALAHAELQYIYLSAHTWQLLGKTQHEEAQLKKRGLHAQGWSKGTTTLAAFKLAKKRKLVMIQVTSFYCHQWACLLQIKLMNLGRRHWKAMLLLEKSASASALTMMALSGNIFTNLATVLQYCL